MLNPNTAGRRRAIYERLNQVSAVVTALKNDVLAGQFDHLDEQQFDALTDWFNQMITGFRHGAEREKASNTVNEKWDEIREHW